MLRTVVPMAFLTLVWGANWSVMKVGAMQLPPLWFRVIGLVIGTAILAVVLVLRGVSLRLPRGSFATVLKLAIPNVVVWYSVATIAVSLLPAGRAAILGYTMPAWAALIGYVLYRERLGAPLVVGVACAVVGVLLLLSTDLAALVDHPLGVVLILGASVCWGFGTHLLVRARLPVDTLVLTFWMMLIACPCILGLSALLEFDGWRAPHGREWWPILYNAVLVLAIGNLIWFGTARSAGPVAAGLASMLVPVVGVFSGIALLGESPAWRDYVALALVSFAVVAGVIPKKRAPLAT